MPYIIPTFRRVLTPEVKPTSPGEVNFCVTSICDDYLQRQGTSYGTLNDLIGALECAKLELYRRVVAPYEDRKIVQNGDVYRKEKE